jgi:hypothetical protein
MPIVLSKGYPYESTYTEPNAIVRQFLHLNASKDRGPF